MIEHPEDRRQRRMEEVRALRGTAERETKIAEIEAERAAAASGKKQRSNNSGRVTRENSSTYFGHPWSEWDAMVDAGYEVLSAYARAQETVPYGSLWGEVSARLGTDIGKSHLQLRALLNHVQERALQELPDVLLTGLVVRDDGSGPSEGFFRLAVAAGLLGDEHDPPVGEPWKMNDAQRAFWQGQVAAVFDRFKPKSGG